MEKKAQTFRLRVPTLEFVRSYAKERHCSQAEVLELAVESLRGDVRGGVPDLPAPVAPKTAPAVVPSLMAERQRRLAKEMGW